MSKQVFKVGDLVRVYKYGRKQGGGSLEHWDKAIVVNPIGERRAWGFGATMVPDKDYVGTKHVNEDGSITSGFTNNVYNSRAKILSEEEYQQTVAVKNAAWAKELADRKADAFKQRQEKAYKYATDIIDLIEASESVLIEHERVAGYLLEKGLVR